MNKKSFFFICLIFLSGSLTCIAQKKDSTTLSSPKSSSIDTNYIKDYKNKLIIGLWQSERKFDININQKLFPLRFGTGINYIANAKHVSGISVDYDIIGFSLGFRSIPSGDARTGNSHYHDWSININTRRLRFENSFRRYTGFYDYNSPNYIHPFTDETPYFQNPNLNLRILKTKLIYTFNKNKFALGAAYANSKRQVKSHGSWLAVVNFYSLNLFSDTSMIPRPIQKDYGTIWDGLNRMNVYALSTGFGGTYTLVFFKQFYFNFLAALGLERQFRYYYTYPENARYTSRATKFTGDWRTSIGYNGKRFFMRLSSIYDMNDFESDNLNFDLKFISGSFNIGYRFNFKTPKEYKKFQETKWYKML